MSTEDEEPADSLSDVEANIRFSPEYAVIDEQEFRLYSASPMPNAQGYSPEIQKQSPIKLTQGELEFAVSRNNLFKSIYRNEGIESDSEDDSPKTSTPKFHYVRRSERQQKIMKHIEASSHIDDPEVGDYSPGSDDIYDPETDKENSKEKNKIPKILQMPSSPDSSFDSELGDQNKIDKKQESEIETKTKKKDTTKTRLSKNNVKDKELAPLKKKEGSLKVAQNIIVTRSTALKSKLEQDKMMGTSRKNFASKSNKNTTNSKKTKGKVNLKLKACKETRKNDAEKEMEIKNERVSQVKKSDDDKENKRVLRERKLENNSARNNNDFQKIECTSLPQTNIRLKVPPHTQNDLKDIQAIPCKIITTETQKNSEKYVKTDQPQMENNNNENIDEYDSQEMQKLQTEIPNTNESLEVPSHIQKDLNNIQDSPCNIKTPEIQKNSDTNEKFDPPQTENNDNENTDWCDSQQVQKLQTEIPNTNESLEVPSHIQKDLNNIQDSPCNIKTNEKFDPPQTENNDNENTDWYDSQQVQKLQTEIPNTNESLEVPSHIQKDLNNIQDSPCNIKTPEIQKNSDTNENFDPPQTENNDNENTDWCDSQQVQKLQTEIPNTNESLEVPSHIQKDLNNIQDSPCNIKIPEIQKNSDMNEKFDPPQTENNDNENIDWHDSQQIEKLQKEIQNTNESLKVQSHIQKDLKDIQDIPCNIKTPLTQKSSSKYETCVQPQTENNDKENIDGYDSQKIQKLQKEIQNTNICVSPESQNDREKPTENNYKPNEDRCFVSTIQKDLKESKITVISETPETQNDGEIRESRFVSLPRQVEDGPEIGKERDRPDIILSKDLDDCEIKEKLNEDNFEVTDIEIEETGYKNSIIEEENNIQLFKAVEFKSDEIKNGEIYNFFDDSEGNVEKYMGIKNYTGQRFDAPAISKDHKFTEKEKIIEKITILENIQIKKPASDGKEKTENHMDISEEDYGKNYDNAEIDIPEKIKPASDGIEKTENNNNMDISEEDYGKNNDNEEKDIQPSIVVSKTRNDGLVRKWDRKQSCLYCNKEVAKLPRHLETKHKEEKEVALLMSHEKNSKQRKFLLDSLRKKGNYLHNTRVLKAGKGMIIPLKRKSTPTMHTNLLPCPSCYGFYSKNKLSRHYRTCLVRDESKAKSVQKAGAELLPIAEGATQALCDKVLSRMANDHVTLVVKQDQLILKLGSKLWMKHEHDEHLATYVSQKMREIARLVIEARKLSPSIVTLRDCIMPENFEKVLVAVRAVAKYDSKTGKYATPSLALKIGHSLKKCAKIIETECLMHNVSPAMAQNFISLCENEWSANISRGALTTLYRNKWNMPDRLPLAEDLKKLNEYLNKQRDKYVQLLKDAQITLYNWTNLAKVALAQTLLFNRRRSGEVERMPVETYEKRSSKPNDAAIMETLTDFEKAISTSFVRFEIRGKKGRKVPVLLYPRLIEVYELLLMYRYHVGIPVNNKFFFAVPPLSNLRGPAVLREFANNCNAAAPENLTSTRLRKNVATMSQVLNLSNNELDQLATFMGHDIRVHREYYRLPESTTQLAKISKILLASERGNLHLYKGKTLEQIEIDPNKLSENEESLTSSNDEDDQFNDSIDNYQNKDEEIALGVQKYIQEDNSESASLEVEDKTAKKKRTPNAKRRTTKKNKINNLKQKRIISSNEEDDQFSDSIDNYQNKDEEIALEVQKYIQEDNSGSASSKVEDKTAKKKRTPNAKRRTTEKNKINNLKQKRIINNKVTKKRKETQKRPWPNEEKRCIEEFFSRAIVLGKVPGKSDCNECIEAYSPLLDSRDWKAVKNCVYNMITRNAKIKVK